MGESWNLSTPAAPAYRDRSTGLVLFGLVEILIAVCALGFSVLMAVFYFSPAMQQLQAQGAPGPRMPLAGVLVYPAVAALFGTLGVGTMLGRRWARAINLVLSWLWLAVGALAIVAMIFILPKAMQAVFAAGPSGTEQAKAAGSCAVVAAVLVAALFYIGLPSAFVLFFRSPHVKATCEEKDPLVRWTDRCPLPVLGAVFCAGYFALASLLGMGYGFFPVAGHLLTGFASVGAYLLVGFINGLLAIGLYRLRPAAWWGTVAFCAFTSISASVLFLKGFPLREMYTAMGTPKEQVEAMEKTGMLELFQGPGLMVPLLVGVVATFAYLFWIRKYFYGYRDPESGPTDTMVSAFS